MTGQSQMKKRFAIALVLLVTLGCGFIVWSKLHPSESVTAASTGTPVAVTRGALRQTVECTGRIVPNLSVEIKCKASGQIVKLPFDVSDVVHQGDLVVEIDPIEQSRNVQKAEAALKASQARLAQSRAALVAAQNSLVADRDHAQAVVMANLAKAKDSHAKANREKELLDKKFSSIEAVETADTTAVQADQEVATARADIEKLNAQEAELDVKRQEVVLDQAEVESDDINLSLAKQYLSETKVMAPIDGVVSTRDVQIGQIISSGISNVGGGTSALTLADMSRLFVLASVDESRIGSVQIGHDVEITVDAFPRQTFAGKVVRIATSGVNVSNVITFEVKVEIVSDNKTLLKPQMTANVVIITAKKSDVLQIPVATVSRTPDGAFVTAKYPDGRVQERVAVEVGISDGTNIEVLKGLDETDAVLPKAVVDSTKSNNSGRPMGPPPM